MISQKEFKEVRKKPDIPPVIKNAIRLSSPLLALADDLVAAEDISTSAAPVCDESAVSPQHSAGKQPPTPANSDRNTASDGVDTPVPAIPQTSPSAEEQRRTRWAEAQAQLLAAGKPSILPPVIVEIPTLRYGARLSDQNEREERMRALAAESPQEAPYDDVLVPGNFPQELLETDDFKVAVADARKNNCKVMITAPDEMNPGFVHDLTCPGHEYTATVISAEFAEKTPRTWRDIYNATWCRFMGDDRVFTRNLSWFTGQLSSDELAEESLYVLLRLNLQHLLRLSGVVRGEFYNEMGSRLYSSDPLPPLTPRAQAAYEEIDRRTAIVTKLISSLNKHGKEGADVGRRKYRG